MGNGRSKFDMPHSFTSNLGTGNFDTAFFAYVSLVFYSFIFTAMTFPILHRPENLFTEKTVFFGFLGTVLMVSGLVTSPYDHSLIFSGEAILI
jgi:hypothetical protein